MKNETRVREIIKKAEELEMKLFGEVEDKEFRKVTWLQILKWLELDIIRDTRILKSCSNKEKCLKRLEKTNANIKVIKSALETL